MAKTAMTHARLTPEVKRQADEWGRDTRSI